MKCSNPHLRLCGPQIKSFHAASLWNLDEESGHLMQCPPIIHRDIKRSLNMRLLRRWFSQLGTSPMALRLHVEHSLKSQV